MALKYNEEYKNTVNICGREIKFRPWNTKDEKEYLISVEAEEEITDELLYNILIKPCIEDKNLILNSNEQKILMIEIRKKSIGSTFPLKYICNSCKNVNDIDVNFDSITNFEPNKFSSFYIEEENNKFKFNFGDILSERLKTRLSRQEGNVNYSFTELLVHIHSIEIDGVLEDSFTFDELKNFIESLPTYIFDKLFIAFQDMKGSLTFKLETYCMNCNGKNDIDFDYIPNFLWV